MRRSLSFVLCLQLIACASTDPAQPSASGEAEPRLALAAKSKSANSDIALESCASPNTSCPLEEKKLPYQCIAYRYQGQFLWDTQRVYAWGSSLCKARNNLQDRACDRKLESSLLSEIFCNPDSSLGACQRNTSAKCSTSPQPFRCVATQYRAQDIPWSKQPLAWANSECLARNELSTVACQRGLNPKYLGSISCEPNPSPSLCPPAPPVCGDAAAVPTTCQVSSIGDITLAAAWTATGNSPCEAQYRLQEMACRLSKVAKQLTPQQLGSMDCRSLVALP